MSMLLVVLIFSVCRSFMLPKQYNAASSYCQNSALHMARRLEKGHDPMLVDVVLNNMPYNATKYEPAMYAEPTPHPNPGQEDNEDNALETRNVIVMSQEEEEAATAAAQSDVLPASEFEAMWSGEIEGMREEEVIDLERHYPSVQNLMADEEPMTRREMKHLEERALEEAKFAEKILQQHPNMPEIDLDEISASFEMKPVMGDTAGCEAPLDAPWRLKAEAIIKDVTESVGLALYDVLWSLREVEVTITAPEDNPEALSVDALSTLARALTDALDEVDEELGILSRHELVVATPGLPNVLSTERQFQAFKGFDVVVTTIAMMETEPRHILGKLVERTTENITLNVKGNQVKIPCSLVAEVKLPDAMYEEGDPASKGLSSVDD